MTGDRDIWAVLPVKGFNRAKQRLAPRYTPEFRAGLARAMVEDVLTAASAVPELSGILVITADRPAADVALSFGARVFSEGAEAGHTAAVAVAARLLAAEGCGAMLTMPGDIPLVSPEEISTLILAQGDAPAFSIVPAHDHRGSNAILCSPPECVPLSFGDDSFYPHLQRARLYGLEPRVFPLPGIALDIDRPSDLELLMREASPTRSWAYVEAHRSGRSRLPASAQC